MWNATTELKGRVSFQFYRDGKLYCKTEGGFMYSIPIDDLGTATALPTDKAIFHMRWIRPQLAEANHEIAVTTANILH